MWRRVKAPAATIALRGVRKWVARSGLDPDDLQGTFIVFLPDKQSECAPVEVAPGILRDYLFVVASRYCSICTGVKREVKPIS
jgi:hypothetical protein